MLLKNVFLLQVLNDSQHEQPISSRKTQKSPIRTKKRKRTKERKRKRNRKNFLPLGKRQKEAWDPKGETTTPVENQNGGPNESMCCFSVFGRL